MRRLCNDIYIYIYIYIYMRIDKYPSHRRRSLLLPFTFFFTYPSRTFTDCGVLSAQQTDQVSDEKRSPETVSFGPRNVKGSPETEPRNDSVMTTPFTFFFTYPSRTFTDCGKIIALKRLHVTLHVSFTDLHGMR